MGLFARVIEKVFHLDPVQCSNCEVLKMIIEAERIERARLINALTYSGKAPEAETEISPEAFKPLTERYTPFSVLKHSLELADRKKFLAEQKAHEQRILAKKLQENDPARAAEVAKLEKELGVDDEQIQASNG